MNLRVCALLMACPVILAQTVTETKWVENWEAGKGRVLLRKINGRWWSEDNREVYPPSKDSFFWTLDSKPGTCEFLHHRPFQLSKAESLHLFMTSDQVEAALGQPNRIFGRDAYAFWYYYGSNGIKLEVRFMDGVLGEATYKDLHEQRTPVASLERELNGQSIYQLMAKRAGQRSQEWLAKKQEENRVDQAARSEALRRGFRPIGSRVGQPSVVTMPNVDPPDPPAPKRTISADALSKILPGITRAEVLDQLGEPNGRYTISDDEGTRESFNYELATGQAIVIRLLNGKVTQVQR